MSAVRLTFRVDFRSPRGRRSHIASRSPVGRVPRVARLMALAIQMDELVRSGVARTQDELAQIGHVSAARISQIMNLTLLAPEIQEALLFLPKTSRGRDAVSLKELQRLARVVEWTGQRERWDSMHTTDSSTIPAQLT